MIEHESGVAVVVDPVRDIGQYLDVTAEESVELAWALETHMHNDFVSGARELVASTNVRLGASGDAGLRYPYERLGDGDEIEVGSWRLQVLATPGHTPEHVAYVLVDPAGEPQALFSGGALMVGTAARTDLFGPALSWRFAHDYRATLGASLLERAGYHRLVVVDDGYALGPLVLGGIAVAGGITAAIWAGVALVGASGVVLLVWLRETDPTTRRQPSLLTDRLAEHPRCADMGSSHGKGRERSEPTIRAPWSLL